METAVRSLWGYRAGDRVRLVAALPELALPAGARGVVCRKSFLSMAGVVAQNRVGVQFGTLSPVVVAESAIAGGWPDA